MAAYRSIRQTNERAKPVRSGLTLFGRSNITRYPQNFDAHRARSRRRHPTLCAAPTAARTHLPRKARTPALSLHC